MTYYCSSTSGRPKFAADPEQCRQEGSLEQGDPMIVDLVLETGKPDVSAPG